MYRWAARLDSCFGAYYLYVYRLFLQWTDLISHTNLVYDNRAHAGVSGVRRTCVLCAFIGGRGWERGRAGEYTFLTSLLYIHTCTPLLFPPPLSLPPSLSLSPPSPLLRPLLFYLNYHVGIEIQSIYNI